MHVVSLCPYGNTPPEDATAPWNMSTGTYGSIPFDGALHSGSEAVAEAPPVAAAPPPTGAVGEIDEATGADCGRETASESGAKNDGKRARYAGPEETSSPPEKKLKSAPSPRAAPHSPTPPNSPAAERHGDGWEFPDEAQDEGVPIVSLGVPVPFAQTDSPIDDGYGSWDDGDDMPNIPILV